MFKQVLVAIDGSPTGNRGLKAAIGLASNQKAALTIMHVVDDMRRLLRRRHGLRARRLRRYPTACSCPSKTPITGPTLVRFIPRVRFARPTDGATGDAVDDALGRQAPAGVSSVVNYASSNDRNTRPASA